MTKLGILIAQPTTAVVLATFLAAGVLAGSAAAQSAKDSSNSTDASEMPATASRETKNEATTSIAAEATRAAASNSAVPTAGLKVVKDPATGELRGLDRAEAARMNSRGTGGPPAAPRVLDLPNGNKLVLLDGEFMSETVARRAPGGNIVMECHPGEQVGHSHSVSDGDSVSQSVRKGQAAGDTVHAEQGGQRDAK